jgi:hypothetical protein
MDNVQKHNNWILLKFNETLKKDFYSRGTGKSSPHGEMPWAWSNQSVPSSADVKNCRNFNFSLHISSWRNI